MDAWIYNLGLVVGTVCFMEGFAWFTHKYIMHGWLWSWHKSHHKVHSHLLERNDLFAIIYSIPSMALIYFGFSSTSSTWLGFIGIGILIYGLLYFIFHDIIVHRRIRIKFIPKQAYLKRIINAHYEHHKVHSKKGGRAFGFLYAPEKYAPKD